MPIHREPSVNSTQLYLYDFALLVTAKSRFIILSVRSTHTLSVTLPPEMLKRT
jgi:hypothetical protein